MITVDRRRVAGTIMLGDFRTGTNPKCKLISGAILRSAVASATDLSQCSPGAVDRAVSTLILVPELME